MAGSGGARKGAGRKLGRASRKTREIADRLAAEAGLTPLEYMIQVMRNPDAATDRRDAMAIAAAPYIHPRLSSTQLTGKDGDAIQVELTAAKDALASRLARLTGR